MGERDMKKLAIAFLLSLLCMGMVLPAARIPAASAASQTSINTAITKALAYLNSSQASDGSWAGYYGYYTVAVQRWLF